MLFTIVILVALIATFVVVKASKSKTQENQPVEETNVPTMVEEPQLEVETVPTVEVVPTTPPSVPTMAAKKKKSYHKKKPAKAKTNA